jgi:hypothetical protein
MDSRAASATRAALKGFAATLSARQVARLRADADFAFASEDREVHEVATEPLAPGDTLPTGVRRIDAGTPAAVHRASTAAVAVIDTGIDLGHADLNAVSGTNCLRPRKSAQDDNGHGTHVAGTIGARNNGAAGGESVVGVSPGTRLYAVKVLSAGGSGTWPQVICGIDWVTKNAARLDIKVANVSLVGTGFADDDCGATFADALHRRSATRPRPVLLRQPRLGGRLLRQLAGTDEADDLAAAGFSNGGPAVHGQRQLDQCTRRVLRGDLAPRGPCTRKLEREVLQCGVVADEHHGSQGVRDAPESREQRRGIPAIELRLDFDFGVLQRRSDPFQRLERPPCGGAEHELRRDARFGDMPRHRLRRPPPARSERTIAIRQTRLLPARLRVTQQVQAPHRARRMPHRGGQRR